MYLSLLSENNMSQVLVSSVACKYTKSLIEQPPSNSDLCTARVQTCRTYLYPSLPVEHRPPTTPRHRTLFWAALVIKDQLVPCCFSSASVSSLQLLRGRPLFLFPCGFQVRAWRVVLDAGFMKVCSIQPHFLRSICLATGSCPTDLHSGSSLAIGFCRCASDRC